jgi:hypothetical protein
MPIVLLYDGLISVSLTTGGLVAQAAAVREYLMAKTTSSKS